MSGVELLDAASTPRSGVKASVRDVQLAVNARQKSGGHGSG
jgi:hypothetical protein